MTRDRESRDRVPELPASALRDLATEGEATEARLDRVWRRLEADLVPVRAPRRRVPDVALAAAAALLVAFVGGVLAGRAFPGQAGPDVTVVGQDRVRHTEPAGGPEQAPAITPEPTARAERAARRPRGRAREGLPSAPQTTEPEGLLLPTADPVPPLDPEWYQLWKDDEYTRAREALEREGGFDAALDQAPADQAMAMVDLARFSHENSLAIAALRRVVERFPGDPNAPIAALTLGNMLERAGDAKGAAQAFEAYRALSPRGDFAEDALARQAEAALEQHDLVRARALVSQYEAEFPNGRSIDELRAQLRRAEGGGPGSTSAPGGAAQGSGPAGSESAAPSSPPGSPSAGPAGAPVGPPSSAPAPSGAP